MQAYSDPTRESDPYALPDVELFYWTAEEAREVLMPLSADGFSDGGIEYSDDELETISEDITGGWYYWFCFPGCLPDSDPIGPFDTEADALADAQSE